MNNTAYIYQPHFMTSVFRVACKEQMADDVNYIVVTCSPSYNGVWKWDARNKPFIEKWTNGRLPCYCVPIKMCTKIKTLEELTNPVVLKIVAEQQRQWKNKEVVNQRKGRK